MAPSSRVLIFLCFVVCVLGAETYYLSTEGTDSNDCGTDSDDACLSMNGVVVSALNAEQSDLTIKVFPGIYGGPFNCNIQFPSTPIAIKPNGDGDVVFDCISVQNATAFFFQDETTLTNLYIKNALVGALLNETFAMSLDTVNIVNTTTALDFSGSELSILNTQFLVSQTAIQIRDISSLNIASSVFSGATNYSILLDTDDNMDELAIVSNNFQNTAGIFISLGDKNQVEAKIDECVFQNITSDSAITIDGGNWKIENFDILRARTGIYFRGGVALVIDDADIIDCDYGIVYSANGTLVVSHSVFNCSTVSITVEQATELEIKDSCQFFGAALSINVVVPNALILLEIEDVTFDHAGGISLNVGAGSNGTIKECSFISPYLRPLSIFGGHWGISDVTVEKSNTTGDGGAFYLQGDESSAFVVTNCDFTNTIASGNGGSLFFNGSSLAISNCEFVNGKADRGGALFAVSYDALSVEDSTFSSNKATTSGGGIDLEKTDNFMFLRDVTFSSNTAGVGAAISCCSIPSSCNATLMYDSDNTVKLEENVSGSGDAITCAIEIGTFQSAASFPDEPISSPLPMAIWLIPIFVVIILLVICGVVLAACYFHRKRLSYRRVD